MQYLVSFLEGIITFLSPCLLPMLPIYISYFAGGSQRGTGKTVRCALGFVLGFTVIFTAMGALAGSIGALLLKYQRIVNLVSGIIVMVFGLNYLGLFRWNLFHGGSRVLDARDMTFFSAALFGVIFSVGWCVSGLRAGSRRSAGPRFGRNGHAADLLAGAWNSLPHQRRSH